MSIYIFYKIFYPIYYSNTIIIRYGLRPFDICQKNPQIWNYLKISFIISFIFNNILLSNFLFKIIFKNIVFKNKSTISKNIFDDNLKLLIRL